MASYLFATAVLGSHLAKASLASYIRDKEPNPREKSNYRQNHTNWFSQIVETMHFSLPFMNWETHAKHC